MESKQKLIRASEALDSSLFDMDFDRKADFITSRCRCFILFLFGFRNELFIMLIIQNTVKNLSSI